MEIHYEDRMSDSDALMWTIEKDPALRSTITTTIVLDSTVPRELLTQKFERLSRVIPRLRQRVRSNPLSIAPPRWEYDPNFDLHFHLWWVKAPGKAQMRDLLSIAEPIAMSGFDRARPLWRAVVVEGLPGKKSAIIMKIHHAVTDGVGGMKLQLELFDMSPDAPEREMPAKPTIHVLSQPERFADAFEHQRKLQLDMVKRTATGVLGTFTSALSDPVGTLSSGGELAASVTRTLRPSSHPMSPLMTGRSLSTRFDVLTLKLDETKRAAKAGGGKLNDAFVGGVARGLYLYHLAHGIDCDMLRMAIPISVRTPEMENVAGNAFVPARIELPVDAEDPRETMRQVRELVQHARVEPANDLIEPLASIINRFPTSTVTALFGSMVKTVDFTTSNVPGAPFPIYLAGARVLSQFPFGPLAGAALNITLLSYQNDLNIGITSDPAAVPDPDVLIASLEKGFDEILSVA
ncbi:MAG TPA: diacylglycerol O-acyltransferase [Acidimicrobiaceae bacterium]|jgi:diacylglycerol O-acyltransferase|nr:diacylglycerol O-acyltransferase [Acidimicrobiaceae bacterium]